MHKVIRPEVDYHLSGCIFVESGIGLRFNVVETNLAQLPHVLELIPCMICLSLPRGGKVKICPFR